jgi:hypothetical protein
MGRLSRERPGLQSVHYCLQASQSCPACVAAGQVLLQEHGPQWASFPTHVCFEIGLHVKAVHKCGSHPPLTPPWEGGEHQVPPLLPVGEGSLPGPLQRRRKRRSCSLTTRPGKRLVTCPAPKPPKCLMRGASSRGILASESKAGHQSLHTTRNTHHVSRFTHHVMRHWPHQLLDTTNICSYNNR